MTWIKSLGRKISGAEARERAELERREAERIDAAAAELLSLAEGRDHFDPESVLEQLKGLMGPTGGLNKYIEHAKPRIQAVISAALDDGLLSPDEDDRIRRVGERYKLGFDEETKAKLVSAKAQYVAWTTPLTPVQTPLMLKKNEWCAHAVRATALEQRQRTVRTSYNGPTARVKIAKGVYYNVGSVQTERTTEDYHHSFGEGVLGATNARLIWVSPAKSMSIPLTKIVMFEPYSDGIKVMKDTGKPILFVFDGADQASMVRISRAIEELRG